MHAVTLDWNELFFGGLVGVMRQTSAIEHAREEPHGSPSLDPWANSIYSAQAEQALAKASNRYWEALAPEGRIGRLRGDVGDWQVRSTHHRNGHLFVYEKDPVDATYFLVLTCDLPVFHIVGWIQGIRARRDEWKTTGRFRSDPWAVPQSALVPYPEEL